MASKTTLYPLFHIENARSALEALSVSLQISVFHSLGVVGTRNET